MEINLHDRERSNPLKVPVPFLRGSVGLGDVVTKITEAVGVKPCTPCEERKRRMNQAVQLQGWGA